MGRAGTCWLADGKPRTKRRSALPPRLHPLASHHFCALRVHCLRAQVDRTHFLTMADCQQFANKCLELGEKPFLGGGMKSKS